MEMNRLVNDQGLLYCKTCKTFLPVEHFGSRGGKFSQSCNYCVITHKFLPSTQYLNYKFIFSNNKFFKRYESLRPIKHRNVAVNTYKNFYEDGIFYKDIYALIYKYFHSDYNGKENIIYTGDTKIDEIFPEKLIIDTAIYNDIRVMYHEELYKYTICNVDATGNKKPKIIKIFKIFDNKNDAIAAFNANDYPCELSSLPNTKTCLMCERDLHEFCFNGREHCNSCDYIYKFMYNINNKLSHIHKTCNVCNSIYPVIENFDMWFSVNSHKKDGLSTNCRLCNTHSMTDILKGIFYKNIYNFSEYIKFGVKSKVCKNCGKTLPKNKNFFNSSKHKLSSVCKFCNYENVDNKLLSIETEAINVSNVPVLSEQSNIVKETIPVENKEIAYDAFDSSTDCLFDMPEEEYLPVYKKEPVLAEYQTTVEIPQSEKIGGKILHQTTVYNKNVRMPNDEYSSVIKNDHRKDVYDHFVANYDGDISKAVILIMPSLNDYEILVANYYGFKDENIIAVDDNAKMLNNVPWAKDHPKIRRYAARIADMPQLLLRDKIKLDIAHLDFCSNTGPALIDEILSFIKYNISINNKLLVSITALYGRESKEISEEIDMCNNTTFLEHNRFISSRLNYIATMCFTKKSKHFNNTYFNSALKIRENYYINESGSKMGYVIMNLMNNKYVNKIIADRFVEFYSLKALYEKENNITDHNIILNDSFTKSYLSIKQLLIDSILAEFNIVYSDCRNLYESYNLGTFDYDIPKFEFIDDELRTYLIKMLNIKKETIGL